jgi:hypothetical protein
MTTTPLSISDWISQHPVDEQDLAASKAHMSKSVSAVTLQRYQAVFDKFTEICKPLPALPITKENLVRYSRCLIDMGVNAETISKNISGLKKVAFLRGRPIDDSLKDFCVELFKANQRSADPKAKKQALPLTQSQISRVANSSSQPTGSRSELVRVITLIGIGGALRLGEALKLAKKDVCRTNSSIFTVRLQLNRTKSKIDQLTHVDFQCDQGRASRAGCTSKACPAHSVWDVRSHACDGPLWQWSSDTFVKELRQLLTRILGPSFDTGRISGHSLRRSGMSSLASLGVPTHVLMSHGRWTCPAMPLTYCQEALARDHPIRANAILSGKSQ